MSRCVHVLAFVAGLTAATVSIAGAQQRERRTPATDRTVNVTRGMRLTINNYAGEIVLRTWDKDAVRVQATHGPRSTIDIQTSATAITIRSKTSGGAQSVDYEINAPAWMPVRAEGHYAFVSVEGPQSEVAAETVNGDIVVKGGTGFVTAKTIQGEVIIEGARGKINASSVNEGIRITGAGGDIVAETTNGDILLTKIDAKSVDVSTVNGDLRYDGALAAGGRYQFMTHNGDITLVLPENSSAAFSVRTYNGDFRSDLMKIPDDWRQGRRNSFTLGSGSAEVELETFGGTIRLRKPGTAPPVKPRDKHRDPEENQPEACSAYSARSATIGSTLAARVAGAAAAASAVRLRTTAIAPNAQGSAALTRNRRFDAS